MKTYKAKASVKRAIIKAGKTCALGMETFEAGKVLGKIGAWYFESAKVKIEEKEEKIVIVKKVANLTPDRRKSTSISPCKLVWDIAEKLLADGLKRKDIIAECEKQGIAFYTARTQYQKYTQAVKASA